MEVTYFNLQHGSYLVDRTPWKLPHGTYTMLVTSLTLQHGSYFMERTP